MIVNLILPPDRAVDLFDEVMAKQKTRSGEIEFKRRSDGLEQFARTLESKSRELDEPVLSPHYSPLDFVRLTRMKIEVEEHLGRAERKEQLHKAFTRDLPTIKLSNNWTRFVPEKFFDFREKYAAPRLDNLLSMNLMRQYDPRVATHHVGPMGTRFNPGNSSPDCGLSSIMADSLSTAASDIRMYRLRYLREVFPNSDEFELLTKHSQDYKAIIIRVDLNSVVDLNNEEVLKAIGLKWLDLLGDVYESRRLTQEIGVVIREAGFDGILAPSESCVGRTELTIFPENVLDWSDRVHVEKITSMRL